MILITNILPVISHLDFNYKILVEGHWVRLRHGAARALLPAPMASLKHRVTDCICKSTWSSILVHHLLLCSTHHGRLMMSIREEEYSEIGSGPTSVVCQKWIVWQLSVVIVNFWPFSKSLFSRKTRKGFSTTRGKRHPFWLVETGSRGGVTVRQPIGFESARCILEGAPLPKVVPLTIDPLPCVCVCSTALACV